MEENKTTETQEVEGQAKTYTQEEVDKMLQAESDKRVAQALKTQERKNAEKVREAQKLAQMNEQQKFEYELQQREQAIIEKERALTLAENKNEASRILAEKGISLSLVDFVVAEDADTMNANISLLDKAFKASVKAEVEKRIGSKAPTKDLPLDKTLTKKDFSKMSIAEQAKLYETNPELYSQLTR